MAAGADTLLAAPAPDPRTEAAEALADSTPTFAPTGIFVVVRDRGVAPTRQPLPRLGGDRGRLTDPGAGGRRSAPGDCFIRSAGKLISVEAPREGVAVIGQGPTKGRQTGDRSLCQWMHQSLPAGLVSGPTCKSRAVSFRRLNSPPRPPPPVSPQLLDRSRDGLPDYCPFYANLVEEIIHPIGLLPFARVGELSPRRLGASGRCGSQPIE